MTCEEALLLISGHLDNENTPEEEAQLQAHLEACPECRSVMQALSEIDGELQNAEAEPPAGFCGDVMRAIRAEATVKRKSRRAWKMAAAAAVAALALGVGVSRLPPYHAKEDTAAPMMMRAAADTAVAASDYVEESPEVQTQMTPYMSATAQISPQELADERGADVVVTYELLPELETGACETLADGTLLYCLENAGGAAELSQTYGLELYEPAGGADSAVSYALLLP